MKENFDQKVKIDGDDEAAGGGMIVKTDQGIEFIKSTKQKKAEESKASELQEFENSPTGGDNDGVRDANGNQLEA